MITLLLLDSLMLSLAWMIAERWGTPVEFFELLAKSSQEPGFLLPILAITLGIVAASGLYGTDDKRRDYYNLCKAISLAQIVLLLIAYLYQPGVIVSRSTFSISWLLALLFVCSGRFLVQLAVVQLRLRGKARRPIFLMGREGDIEEAKKLLNKTGQYKIRGQALLPA
ncbi:MAG TPA: glucosyl transferase, partial [Cyanobacteria bacterium UBA11372]|nr:glucosyl transferase [Cyanobacteria bacterium UBA11372]